MRKGGGKQKGADFERTVCKKLSLWVSAGKQEDCFWRSAMSGGRATLSQKKGVSLVRQAGDITATSAEGHSLTDFCYIECKHYRDLDLLNFILFCRGTTAKFWRHARHEAACYDRQPMLIMKQNRIPIVVVTRLGVVKALTLSSLPCLVRSDEQKWELYLFDDITNEAYKKV